MTGAAALRCRDVVVEYKGLEVLHGVDLTLELGSWIGLIGPNGAGKSSLLKAIAGVTPSSGSVAIEGRRPGAKDLALVPQRPLLPSGMTVAEYVLLGRTAHLDWLARESTHDRAIVAEVLKRLDLAQFGSRFVSTLSGGEAQRVAIARALAQEAPILLLDEPTSALDLGHQVTVLELVDDLRKSDGLSVIAAMHDLTTAARFADELLLLHDGHVASAGTPTEVLQPELLSTTYGTELRVREIDGELVVLPAPRT